MKERNYSLDVYRFLCMFLITTIHIMGYSNLITYIPWTHVNFYIVDFIKVLQLCSINGFVMISGYFLVNSTDTAKKIISFEIQLLFYSVFLFAISLFFNTDELGVNLIKSFFPLLTNHYWYAFSYVILLIAVPWINRIIRALNKKELLTIIIFLSLLISFFFQFNPFFDSLMYVGYKSRSLLWFFLLYLISAYIRLYGVKTSKKTGITLFILSGCILGVLMLINDGVFDLVNKIPLVEAFFKYIDVLSYISLPSLLLTVSTFIIFTNMKINVNKVVACIFKIVTPALFGVYLIQEHRAIRGILWNFVSINDWAQSYWLVGIIILVFIGLLLLSVLIHLLYTCLQKVFLNRVEDYLCKLYETQKQKLINKLQQ